MFSLKASDMTFGVVGMISHDNLPPCVCVFSHACLSVLACVYLDRCCMSVVCLDSGSMTVIPYLARHEIINTERESRSDGSLTCQIGKEKRYPKRGDKIFQIEILVSYFTHTEATCGLLFYTFRRIAFQTLICHIGPLFYQDAFT